MADDQTQDSSQSTVDSPQTEEKPKKETSKEEVKAEEPAKSVKISANLQKLIGEIEKLSVLELSRLVIALEEKFGVSAAPAVVAGGASPAASDAAPEEGVSEQTTFNVILTDSGANKISVIKAVRELVPTLGLKEAKDLVDAPPKPVLEGVNKETSQEAKTKLEAAGAKVELK